MTRTSGKQDLRPGEVYIGRGTQWGLPKSIWHNRYVIDKKPGGLTRDQVIAALRSEHLEATA